MLQNISIKKLLYAIPVLLVLSFIALYLFISANLASLEDKSLKASLSNKIIKTMAETRISEKNFKLRKDVKYIGEVDNNTKNIVATAKKLKGMFHDSHNITLTTEIIENTEQYSLLFNEYQKRVEKSLKIKQEMVDRAQKVERATLKIRAIQKRRRDNTILTAKNPQKIVDAVEKASITNKILKELADIRIAEKNFIIRKNQKYMDEIVQSIKAIGEYSQQAKKLLRSAKTKKLLDNAVEDLVSYHNAISQFDALREESFQISKKMKSSARKDEDLASTLREGQKQEKIELSRTLKINMISAFIVISILLILLIIFVSRVIIDNLTTIHKAAHNLAMGDADLTKRIEMKGDNEVTLVANRINEFIEKVQLSISNAKEASSQVASISKEVADTSLKIRENVEDEAHLVNATTKDIDNMTHEAQIADDKANDMYKILENSSSSLNSSILKIKDMVEIVKESSVKEEDLAQKMSELRSSTDDVKSILELIGDIAEQTNLLSLNAAIEAARAGEHGRGFAVVADEVRKLAERTQKSLTEINATINVVVQAVDESSETMQENAKSITLAAEQAGDVEASIDEVVSEVENSKVMAQESSQASQKLKDEVLKISDKMSKLNETATQNARGTEEVASAINAQNSIIESLNKELMAFKS